MRGYVEALERAEYLAPEGHKVTQEEVMAQYVSRLVGMDKPMRPIAEAGYTPGDDLSDDAVDDSGTHKLSEDAE